MAGAYKGEPACVCDLTVNQRDEARPRHGRRQGCAVSRTCRNACDLLEKPRRYLAVQIHLVQGRRVESLMQHQGPCCICEVMPCDVGHQDPALAFESLELPGDVCLALACARRIRASRSKRSWKLTKVMRSPPATPFKGMVMPWMSMPGMHGIAPARA